MLFYSKREATYNRINMKFNAIKNKGGIYMIVNLINGKIYIGKTKNFYKRYYQYLYDIKKQRSDHINDYLLNSFNKHGQENFHFDCVEVVEDLDEKYISERELFWMDCYNSCNRHSGYNLRRDSSTGMVTHKNTSDKISKRLKKEWKEGKRFNHSKKLKEYWKSNNSRKIKQSKIMSKNKTKYYYLVTKNGKTINCNFSKLKEMKLQNCQATFNKKKTDFVTFKGYEIRRCKLKI
jgi:group I intron endonuclease